MKSILSMVIGASLACCAIEAGAEEPITLQKIQLDIARQSLNDALNAWAEQTGFQLVCLAPEVARDLLAPKVKGAFTPTGALEQLLSGTPLAYEFTSERTVTVRARFTAASRTTGYLDRVDAPRVQIAKLTAAEERTGQPPESNARGVTDSSPAANRDGAVRAGDFEELEEVVVTGTHIRAVSNATIPALVFTREDIERTGYSTPQELFRNLPQNFSGSGVSEAGVLGNGANSGRNLTEATAVDLRGLGPTSTLFLIDGRRVAPTVFGSVVDISLVPLAAVDRIEIITDGSSAVYGSDAVAGVVNVRMRRDYDGAETRLRYGGSTEGGASQRLLSQTIGKDWSDGNALITAQYQDADPLHAEDRSFRGAMPRESQLLPESRSWSGLMTLHQRLTDTVEFSTDALVSRRNVRRFIATSTGNTVDASADVDSDNFAAQLAYQPTAAWNVALSGQYSSQKSKQEQTQVDEIGTVSPSNTDQGYQIASASLIASGELFEIRSATLNVAFGGEYREEKQDDTQVSTFGTVDTDHDRRVKAVFGETYLSLIQPGTKVAGLRALDFSGSMRYDDYSDFGSTSNFRVGTRISPANHLNFRASYSTSFRAPNTLELAGSTAPLGALIIPFETPTGDFAPGFFLFGGGKSLKPEEADSWSIGVDYSFTVPMTLRVGASYYDIKFRDRIIQPPFAFDALLSPDVYGPIIGSLSSDAEAEALLDSIRAGGGTVIDILGTGGAGVRSTYDQRLLNASRVHQTGIDLWIEAAEELPFGQLNMRANVATIDKIDSQFTVTAQPDNIVDSFASPLDLRARLDIGLTLHGSLLNFAVNYTDGYHNTVAPGAPKIGSWTTLDFTGRLDLSSLFQGTLWKGTAVSLAVQNILDKDPPFADASGVGIDVHFDQANAGALGRFAAIQIEKMW